PLAPLSPSPNHPAFETPAKTAPKRGFFRRIFGGGSGGPSKAERQLSKADRQALGQATPELMEQLLAERIQVTEDELRDLMTARARWTQDWLVQNGQVTAE